MLRNKKVGAINPKPEDFTFYVMDEANCLYNVQCMPYLKRNIEAATYETETDAGGDESEPARKPDGLIYIDFKFDFLFQDLRVAFYRQPEMKISIIGLKH